ncbi:MAG TPA: pYEATS domain-containing protein [Blastocatellia bacterium]|jgi:nucleoside phosphorylase|nr:pYEATS domain-containing protein [Blastocatellia bacterium]
MPYNIEILSIGGEFCDETGDAFEILNSVQGEFRFHLPPARLRMAGLPFRRKEYYTKDVFDFLRNYRKEAKGHRPYLIAVLSGPLYSDRYHNLFGSHEASEGLAVVTLRDHARYSPSASSFLCYYFIRYSLSFVAPSLRSHRDTRSCFFDKKIHKPDLLKSLYNGELCDPCMAAMQQSLNPEIYEATRAMIGALKSSLRDSPSSSRGAPSATGSPGVLVYEPEAQSWFPKPMPEPTFIPRAEAENLTPGIDVVLVTATATEKSAALNLLRSFPRKRKKLAVHVNQETYYIGQFGAYRAALTMCDMGAMGRDSVILSTKDALDFWRPKAVIMLGIAFGRDPSQQAIGDVLVAKQIISYEEQRVGDQIATRGSKPLSGATLLNRFRHADGLWKFLRPDKSRAKIHIGAVLSGEKLVDSVDFKRKLFETYRDAIGGEMEGAGLYAAAARAGTEWILVKAICDWADGKKHNKHQPLAAAAAASLVHYVLSDKTTLDGLSGGRSRTVTPRHDAKNPQLRAEFVLNSKGNVRRKKGSFEIRLFIADPPSGTRCVVYKLDESYVDPVRKVWEAESNFEEYITAYGDFEVNASLHPRKSKRPLKKWLSRALENHYGSEASAEITHAINVLEKK